MIKDAHEALEFGKVLGLAARYAHSEPTKAEINSIRPLADTEDMRTRFALIEETRRLERENTPLPISRFEDIGGVLESVRPVDAVLEPAELLKLVPLLGIAEDTAALISSTDGLTHLLRITEGLGGGLERGPVGSPEIRKAIEGAIDLEGNIVDDASPELKELRRRIRKLEGRIRASLEALVRDSRLEPFIQDDFVTKRSGRWVIPVRMDAKGQVDGVVHDVSRTGDTAFMEPLETIGPANELENLSAEARAEELRILRALSAMVRAEDEEISAAFDTVVSLDVLLSIARLADRQGMETPTIGLPDEIRIKGARHPLLAEAFSPVNAEASGPVTAGKSGSTKTVVPLDVSLDEGSRVMVITGPNAGGKTIAIKTVGLLTLMALSGMPVPADGSSVFPALEQVLVDIGDEQSIEQSLSTFSAHINNISGILKSAGPGTLVLMDELGTGTDPSEGAALACAVLGDLMKKEAMVFATTHLIDIVAFVHKSGGMQNASMEFHQKTHTPLYRLKHGEPGRSHALEIARKYGLPDSTVNAAKEHMGGMKAEFSELLADLKEQRARHEEALRELEKEKAALTEKERELEARLERTERERSGKIKEAYEEARRIVQDTKRIAHAALKEAKEKEPAAARGAVRKLEKEARAVSEKLREFSKGPALSIDDISPGDTVFLYSIGYDVTVQEVDRKNGRLKVKAGAMAIDVSAEDAGPRKGRTPEVISKRAQEAEDMDSYTGPAAGTLNIVGKRVEESLSLLETFLNRASLNDLREVSVIHGIGEGILMKAVREHLDGHPLVEGYRGGGHGEGGAGVTVVRLK